jgi:predicted anti-sigma-YlaC factor YlaD
MSMAEHRHDHEEITCREFVEVVTEYLDGVMPEDQVELIEEHLVMCDWCKTYLDQLDAIVAALPAIATPEPVPAPTREALLTMFRGWKAAH